MFHDRHLMTRKPLRMRTCWTMTTNDHRARRWKRQPLETYVPPAKPSLIGLSRAEIADRLGEIGVAPAQRKMRVQQLWHWMYFRGAKVFAEMTSISKEMRAELEQHFTVDRPEVVAEQISNDGTRKWLLRLPSGDSVEKAA